MNTKIIMITSALLMGFAGLILTFFPEEITKILNMPGNSTIVLLLQMLGAMYFALGMLNWMSKNSRIGGIYNRPIAIANMTHFMMVGITMAKLMIAGEVLPGQFWLLVAIYLFFAIVFIRILFKTPKIGSANSVFFLALMFLSCGQEIEQSGNSSVNFSSALENATIVDLSHAYSDETIYWVTAKEFMLDSVFAGETEKGFYYAANNFSGAEHGGTHIDAPIHFSEGKKTVDKIPLKNLIGQAVKVDVSAKALDNPDYLVEKQDFIEWEKKHGIEIGPNHIVLVQTGHSAFYSNPEEYLGTNQRGEEAVKLLHFPGLAPEAAQWLALKGIKAFGIDTPSIDYGQSELFESHVILLSENIPGFENLTELDQLPETGFDIVALPMKIKGGSGGPLRIIALIPQ